MPRTDPTRTPDRKRTPLQWFTGCLLAGWGLSILVGIVPHEDLTVGAGLAILGLALAVSARNVPDIRPMPTWPVAAVAALMVVGALTFGAWRGWNAPKLAILALGALLVAGLPFQSRRIPLLFKRRVTVASLLASLLPMALGPAAVYATQGMFLGLTGRSPVEAFIEGALLVPMAFVMDLIGWDPVRTGQTIHYLTPSGPLRLQVGVACSGLQAMAMFSGILAILLMLERPPAKRAALLCVIGLAGVYVINLLRLILLAVVGYHYGAEALEQAHAQAGWILFVAWALTFTWLAKRITAPPRAKPLPGARSSVAPGAPQPRATPLREGVNPVPAKDP